MDKTFDAIANRRSTRKQGFCPICGEKYPEGQFRGRIQLVLYKHRPLATKATFPAQKKGQKQATQEQKTVATESRIACESCAVALYVSMADELPERQKVRHDKPKEEA